METLAIWDVDSPLPDAPPHTLVRLEAPMLTVSVVADQRLTVEVRGAKAVARIGAIEDADRALALFRHEAADSPPLVMGVPLTQENLRDAAEGVRRLDVRGCTNCAPCCVCAGDSQEDREQIERLELALDEVCGIAKDWTRSEKVRARIDELRERAKAT